MELCPVLRGSLDGGQSLGENLVVQLLSRFQFFAAPWTAAHRASLSFTIPWSLLQLISAESAMAQELLSVPRSKIQNAFSLHGFLLLP